MKNGSLIALALRRRIREEECVRVCVLSSWQNRQAHVADDAFVVVAAEVLPAAEVVLLSRVEDFPVAVCTACCHWKCDY